ncbi:MAG: hypothetical protein WC710_14915 [Gallionella sp.]|jgi:hypothetical protein
MKILFLALALFYCSASAADPWRTEDTYWEAAYLTVHTLDWAQTHTIAANPDKFFEHNPALGEHPDSAQINTYFALTALVHYGIARKLPSGWRTGFQGVTFAIETISVVRNFSLGIGGSF